MSTKDRDRERRLAATGRWFQKSKKPMKMWLNLIFPVLLVIALINYLIWK